MPQVYNGCGTWYYGKKNVQTYEGACRACGRISMLTSYDTRLYVVVLMVPVIPLGKKRIIEQCAACKRHFAVPWDEYNRAENRMRETLAAYRQNPQDLDAAREVVQACVSFRNLRAFLEIAPEIEQGMSQNAKGLAMLGSVYEVFGRLPDVERLLRRAAELEPEEDELRELLARNLLRQGRPDEAEPLTRHIVEKGIPDRVDLLYLLAQVYQSKGQHEKAMAAFRLCEQVNPLINKDEGFNQLREASEKNRGTGKVLQFGEVTRKAAAAKKRKKFARVAAVVTVLAAVAYVVMAGIIGTRRTVYLVNGLDVPYTATLDGKAYALGAKQVQKVMLGEGKHRVQVNAPSGSLPPEDVNLHSTFLTRPFSKDVFVINPDATAILRHARVFYSRGGGREPEEQFQGGRVMWHFDDVDHPFEEPPQKLMVDSNSGERSRVVLNVLGPETQMSGASLLLALERELGKPAVATITRRHVQLEPNAAEYFGLLAKTHKPDEIVEFLKPLVELRPIAVQWHRAYQSYMSELAQDEQVERQYLSMLEKDPQNKELMYLTSRVVREPDRSVELCRQAAEGTAPPPYACFSMSGYCMETGDFAEAAKYARKTIGRSQDQPELLTYQAEALAAAGFHREALDLMRPVEDRQWPSCMAAFNQEIAIACLMHDRAAATQVIDRMRLRIRTISPELLDRMVAEEDARIAYAFGDMGVFQRICSESTNPDARLRAAVSRGDIDACEKGLAELKKQSPDSSSLADWHALIYLAARAAHNAAAAQKHLSASADLMAKGSYEDRLYAESLRGKPSLPVEKLLHVRQESERKLIYLAVFASVDPGHRDAYVELAGKLNYQPQFPKLVIDQAISPASAANEP
jgi:tetratricopeptide (TPR) repeat protein